MEILQTSLKVTILGMGIVFVALIGLVLIIMAMHRLTGNKKDDRKISVEKADTVSEQKRNWLTVQFSRLVWMKILRNWWQLLQLRLPPPFIVLPMILWLDL